MVTQSDNTNTGVVATIVVVGAFSMIAISALLTAMVRKEETDIDALRPMHADLQTIAALDQQQLSHLEQAPHWADKPAGKLAIPIAKAMSLVVQEYRKDPAAASPPPPPGFVMPPPTPAEGTPGAAAAPGVVAPAPGVVASAPNASPGHGAAAAPGAAVPAPNAPPGHGAAAAPGAGAPTAAPAAPTAAPASPPAGKP